MKKNVRLFLLDACDSGFKVSIKNLFAKKINFSPENEINIKPPKQDDMVIVSEISSIGDEFNEKKDFISDLDVSPSDMADNMNLLNDVANINAEVKVINWLLPDFDHVLYGGIYTILRFAAYFQEKGLHNRIIIYNNRYSDAGKIRDMIVGEFGVLADAEFIIYDGQIDSLPECDAVISTLWTSCYLSLRSNRTRKKFYFIQDYEPLFYSANSYYALAEATYRFGFRGIVNTPGLAEFVKNQHGIGCEYFYPSVDDSIYNISEDGLKIKLEKKIIDIFVYGRPNHDRNAFELALVSLIKLKDKYGDRINIFSAGDEWNEDDYGVKGVIKNLGRLDSLEKVADLYRKCDIGLVFMFTKHPSYQPFEYMSCGCAVVTNYNKSNLWFLKDGGNALLSEPMPSCIVEKISQLIENRELREKIIRNGITEVSKNKWSEECEKIYEYVIG
jgi:glycosyltransferase involved in cell wall biosynthesis